MKIYFTVFDFSTLTASVPCLNMTVFFLKKLVDSLCIYIQPHHLLIH